MFQGQVPPFSTVSRLLLSPVGCVVVVFTPSVGLVTNFFVKMSPICPLCQVEEEDLEHILLDCTSINCHRNTLQSLLPQTSVEMLQYILTTPMLWTIAELTYSLHRGNHQLALEEA